MYQILAELTMFVHLLWILFVLVGVIFAVKGSKLAWLHLGGLLFSLPMNFLGWYCPLTYLENVLRRSAQKGAYPGSFMLHFLEIVIYPDFPEEVIRLGVILFVCFNLAAYGVVAKRYLRRL